MRSAGDGCAYKYEKILLLYLDERFFKKKFLLIRHDVSMLIMSVKCRFTTKLISYEYIDPN